jgi:hypothetical protein
VLNALAPFQAFHSITSEVLSKGVALFLLQLVNTAVLVLVLNAYIDGSLDVFDFGGPQTRAPIAGTPEIEKDKKPSQMVAKQASAWVKEHKPALAFVHFAGAHPDDAAVFVEQHRRRHGRDLPAGLALGVDEDDIVVDAGCLGEGTGLAPLRR